ncbi:MAG: exo-alpha-sialidase [Planctomycetes bacterium]|nr:exo-alpha-sialidase [Planctomycetota bacterium]
MTACHARDGFPDRWKTLLLAAVLSIVGIGVLHASADEPANAAESASVPGVVIDHQPASSGKYVGSPSIAILPGGDYVASHDVFGPKSGYRQRATTRVFRSGDRGLSWRHLSDIDGQLWSTLFVHRGALYIIGTLARYNDTIIRRSADGGQTWTEPDDGNTGVLLADGKYHCAPQPVVVHVGRIWRGMEDADGPPKGWAKHFRAFMMSAPVDADLLRAESWTVSNRLASDATWLDGKFGGWLEGNAVVAPDGGIVNVLRVEYPEGGGKAAIVEVSDDGRTVSFDPETGFVDLPGGCTKFTIRFDPASKHYWTLSNYMPPRHLGLHPGATRNTLALVRSKDLRQWEVRSIVAYHHDVKKHGFQYPDWQLEGDDIVAVSRTAYDDGLGGAHNYHDANYLTFHRLADFRRLNDLELPPMPPPVKTTAECADFLVEGFGFNVATLDNDARAYGNRNYTWKDVPEPFRGWRFTQVDGGVHAKITVTARRDTVIHAATGKGQEGTDTTGWELLDAEGFHYSTKHRSPMLIMRRPLQAGQTLTVGQTNWSGALLLLPPEGK